MSYNDYGNDNDDNDNDNNDYENDDHHFTNKNHIHPSMHTSIHKLIRTIFSEQSVFIISCGHDVSLQFFITCYTCLPALHKTHDHTFIDIYRFKNRGVRKE